MALNKIHQEFLDVEKSNYISIIKDDINFTDLGWSTYVDTAAINPTDGIGGTANITFAKNLSNPLSGNFDFRLTKDAVNRQGQGFSIPFTISNIHLAKVLQITFDMEFISGTYSTGDLRVSIIQDPIGTPVCIEPVNTNIQLGIANQRIRHIATFQSHISITSYRLCIHVSSTSSSAYIVDFANFKVWEPTQSIGAVITEPQSYIATIRTPDNGTIAKGTINNESGSWHREGKHLILRYNLRITTAGGTGGTGTYFFLLPSGLSIDYTNINGGGSTSVPVLGAATISNASGIYSASVVASGASQAFPNSLMILPGDDNTSGNPISSTYFPLSVANQSYGFEAIIPIAGWGSNVAMSSDSGDGRVVACLYNTGANITVSTSTPIRYTNRIYDTHGAYDTSTGKFTAPISGFYNVKGSLRQGTATDYFVLYKGSSIYQRLGIWTSGDSYNLYNGVIQLNAGETLEIRPEIASLSISSTTVHYFAVERISSGSQIIATQETVSASYYSAATQTSLTTQINFGVRVYDTHGAVTTGVGAWKFTAPISGKYLITGFIGSSSSVDSWIDTYINDTFDRRVIYTRAVSGMVSFNMTLNLLSGQWFYLRPLSSMTVNGDSSNNGNRSWIEITRIGN